MRRRAGRLRCPPWVEVPRQGGLRGVGGDGGESWYPLVLHSSEKLGRRRPNQKTDGSILVASCGLHRERKLIVLAGLAHGTDEPGPPNRHVKPHRLQGGV